MTVYGRGIVNSCNTYYFKISNNYNKAVKKITHSHSSHK